MNIEHLGNHDVTELEKTIGLLQVDNPDIKYTVYPMEDKEQPDSIDMITRVKNIENSVERIETVLLNIFGNNVLIDGRFIDIKTGKSWLANTAKS